jgi:hypothetical protein
MYNSGAKRLNEDFSVFSDTKLSDRLISLYANKSHASISPTKGDAFLKVSHCTVAGTTPTPWRKAPVCVTKDATQPPRTKPPPNPVTSGANSLRSQGLYFLLIPPFDQIQLHVRLLHVLPEPLLPVLWYLATNFVYRAQLYSI